MASELKETKEVYKINKAQISKLMGVDGRWVNPIINHELAADVFYGGNLPDSFLVTIETSSSEIDLKASLRYFKSMEELKDGKYFLRMDYGDRGCHLSIALFRVIGIRVVNC